MRALVKLIRLAVVAGSLVSVAPAAAVLVPPAEDYTPDRSGGPVAACGGDVLCVGPSEKYATIGAAVAAASKGATIQVQAGTYKERVVINKQIALRGGFASGFGSRNPATDASVIDGENGGSVIVINAAPNSVIDGFTITGGKAKLDENILASGSGISVLDSSGVEITRNLIQGNDDKQDFNSCNCSTVGGGIAASGAPGTTITIRDNVIKGNTAHRGGAMAIFVSGLIAGNLVEDNVGTSDHGGGLYLGATKITVRQNLVRGNTIGRDAGYGWGGGGIFFGSNDGKVPRGRFEANRWVGNSAPSVGSGLFIDENAFGRVVGDLFHDNKCPDGGGAGVYVDGGGVPNRGSKAILENVTIANNDCPGSTRGAGIFTEGASGVTVFNSIIFGNGGTSEIFICAGCAPKEPKLVKSSIAYSIVGKTVKVKKGKGVRGGDPGFVNPAGGDFHLKPGSKAINGGDPKSSAGAEPNGGKRDLGAYGGTAEAP